MIANLPQTAFFIGRDDELRDISGLIHNPLCRLLTLVGPGGIGKTRLALEIASSQQDLFPDGVHLIYLQATPSSDFLVSAVAESLDFRFQPDGDPQSQLINYLRHQSLLLVLDNIEHLADGVAFVGDILAAATAVKLLVTSRERLSLQEEWVYEVRGLDCPAHDGEPDIEGYGAVQLFVHSARRVSPHFRLTKLCKPPVARICRLVGGMPLGIELAAAWTRALPCDEIAHEIEHSLDTLETSARNVPPRHRNMRAVFAPTWQRMSAEEQHVFMKLSIFRGGFTRQAAESAAGATMRTLLSLVDKSLLRLDGNGRYTIHELLRQYGEEQLNTLPPEREETLDLHRACYMDLLARCEQLFVYLGRQKEALAIMKNELENMRLAWQRAVLQGRFAEMAGAGEAFWTFY
jgi:predicted ATPase